MFPVSTCNSFETLYIDTNDATQDQSYHTDQPSALPDDETTDSTSSLNSLPNTDFIFSSKGFHIANFNVRRILPKLDELQITLATDNDPDILDICETFLDRYYLSV